MRFEEIGLPAPLTQVSVYDEAGRLVGIADFAFPEQKTIAEFDGQAKYALDGLTGDALSARLFAEKRRQERLDRLGWEIVRIVWADLYRRAWIAAEMRAAASRAAARGPVRGTFSLTPRLSLT